jgi:hypothetical protein
MVPAAATLLAEGIAPVVVIIIIITVVVAVLLLLDDAVAPASGRCWRTPSWLRSSSPPPPC